MVKLPNARTCAMIQAAAEKPLNAAELARAAGFEESQAWVYASRAVEAGWMRRIEVGPKDASDAKPTYVATPEGCNLAAIATGLREDA